MSKLLKVEHMFSSLSPQNLTLFLPPNRFSLRVLWINIQWIISTAISSHGWTWSEVHISVDFKILSQLSNSWGNVLKCSCSYTAVVEKAMSLNTRMIQSTAVWLCMVLEWACNTEECLVRSLSSWYWSVKHVKHRGWLRDEEEIEKGWG